MVIGSPIILLLVPEGLPYLHYDSISIIIIIKLNNDPIGE